MTKVEMARDIYESSNGASRMATIARIMEQTNSGEAYASTLYNKARKMSAGEVETKSKSGNKEAFAALGNKLKKKVDEAKDTFIKNCHKIQGLRPYHYNMVVNGAMVVGVNKHKELVCVKPGTKTKVKVDTKSVMSELRKIKRFGKKK